MGNEKDLRTTVKERLERQISNRRKLQTGREYLTEHYNFPANIAADYLTLRQPLEDVDRYVLFALLSSTLSQESETSRSEILKSYFDANEIREFSNRKWETETIGFPLRFKMVKIEEDQWIGKITVRSLMELKDAQLIYYNENTQRTMQHVVSGKAEYWRIAVNRRAVDEIAKAYQTQTYIPNTITLNMPHDTNYHYSEERSELVISSIDHFDILDGYHRYLAMSQCTTEDENFDQAMELRIVAFSEDLANRFIYQEDQKTKMRRVDSSYYNQDDIANDIVRRLNKETFALGGKITPNNGIVNAPHLAQAVRVVYVDPTGNQQARLIQTVETVKELKAKLGAVVEADESLLKHSWDKAFIWSIVLACKDFEKTKDILKHARELYGLSQDKATSYLFAETKPTRRTITRLRNTYKKGGSHV